MASEVRERLISWLSQELNMKLHSISEYLSCSSIGTIYSKVISDAIRPTSADGRFFVMAAIFSELMQLGFAPEEFESLNFSSIEEKVDFVIAIHLFFLCKAKIHKETQDAAVLEQMFSRFCESQYQEDSIVPISHITEELSQSCDNLTEEEKETESGIAKVRKDRQETLNAAEISMTEEFAKRAEILQKRETYLRRDIQQKREVLEKLKEYSETEKKIGTLQEQTLKLEKQRESERSISDGLEKLMNSILSEKMNSKLAKVEGSEIAIAEFGEELRSIQEMCIRSPQMYNQRLEFIREEIDEEISAVELQIRTLKKVVELSKFVRSSF